MWRRRPQRIFRECSKCRLARIHLPDANRPRRAFAAHRKRSGSTAAGLAEPDRQRDWGKGIDLDHAERVFDAFYTTKSGGMGMGLAICRSIMQAHGGRLWAMPNSPRGAVFQFQLLGCRNADRPSG